MPSVVPTQIWFRMAACSWQTLTCPTAFNLTCHWTTTIGPHSTHTTRALVTQITQRQPQTPPRWLLQLMQTQMQHRWKLRWKPQMQRRWRPWMQLISTRVRNESPHFMAGQSCSSVEINSSRHHPLLCNISEWMAKCKVQRVYAWYNTSITMKTRLGVAHHTLFCWKIWRVTHSGDYLASCNHLCSRGVKFVDARGREQTAYTRTYNVTEPRKLSQEFLVPSILRFNCHLFDSEMADKWCYTKF